MFSACFCGRRTALVVMHGDSGSRRGGVKAEAYTAFLAERLPLSLDADTIIMHENARPNIANHAQPWVRDNSNRSHGVAAILS